MPSLGDVLSGIGTVLDTPGSFVRTALAGDNPFASILDTDKRVTGRELLERYGLAGENTDQGWIPDAGDLGGFAAEMALDPLNLVGGGLLKRLIGMKTPVRISRTSKGAEEALSSLPRHTMDDIGKIARGESGDVTLYHGAPEHIARKMETEGAVLPAHAEDMARQVADAYGIPWTEWVHRVTRGSPTAGYGTDVSRLSTATPGVAARFAESFPHGEVLTNLNSQARLYREAQRLGISVDDLVERHPGGYEAMVESLDLPNKLPTSKYGNVMAITADARAIPKNSRRDAQRILKTVTSNELSLDDALDLWNNQYRDIKIHPSNVKSATAVTQPLNRKYPLTLAALLAGQNTLAHTNLEGL